jgi:very-short-patch-repair endonuclease
MIEKLKKLKKINNIKHLLSNESEKELIAVYEYCLKEKISFYNCINILVKMITYNVPPSWVDRIQKSKNIYKNDSSSLECHKIRYGEEIGELLYKQKTESCIVTKEKYLQNHTLEQWIDLCSSKINNKLEVLVERHGEEIANKKRQQYLENWRKTIKDKGGWDNGLSLEKLTEKHGKEEGLRKWNEKKQKQRKRFSKEYFINKYGDKQGEEEWLKYKQHMSSLSLSAQKVNGANFSKVSQRLFENIVNKANISKDEVFYKECNGEKIIKRYVESKYMCFYSLDFLYKNKVIEFDGKRWHNEPLKDAERDLFLVSKGYEVLRIKEEDYKKNPTAELDKCLLFLGVLNE